MSIYYNVEDFNEDVKTICNGVCDGDVPGLKKPDKNSDLIIHGVPRGGSVAAAVIAERLGACLVSTLDPWLDDPDHVLVVDDIVDSGKTRSRYSHFPFVALVGFQDDQERAHCKVARRVPRDWVNFWWEIMPLTHEEVAQEGVQDNILRILQYIGEDPNRDGLRETPARVMRSYDELFSGYRVEDVSTVFKTFESGAYDQIVLLKDCPFYSMCEHHMLPFTGTAHVAYIPSPEGKIVGISKLARLLEVFSRRLQIQERIGQQVTSALMENLEPLGAACVIESEHLCMGMRGVNRPSTMVTSSVEGVFREKVEARNELMELIRGKR